MQLGAEEDVRGWMSIHRPVVVPAHLSNPILPLSLAVSVRSLSPSASWNVTRDAADIDDPATRQVLVCSFAGTLTVIPRPALNMTVPLGSPQPVFALPPLDAIPDVEEDKPVDGLSLVRRNQARVQITVIDTGIGRDRLYGLA